MILIVKIVTFGDFDIILNGNSIVEEIATSQKIIKLFKYFLVHKGMKLLAETIIEDLWIDEDFKNPISMLRTQISRLRNIIESKEIDGERFFTIDHINGYYLFTLEEGCVVDFVEFENLLQKDYISLKEAIDKNPSKIDKIVSLYRGEFLSEVGEEDWLVPLRSKYDRFYVKGLSYYLEYLKENREYNKIVSLCEKAMEIKPYEELIHISFMEALVELKQNSYALIHYEFFTKKLFNDLKITPSKQLKQVYKKIKSKEESYANIDLNRIEDEMLREFDFEGILYCDIDYFKFLYNYEKRNKDRRVDKSIGIGVGIISIYNEGYEQLKEKEIKDGMDQLIYILYKILRNGDIVSKWNNNQVVIMLYEMKKEHIKTVVDKINNRFDLEKLDERLSLNIKLDIL